MEVTPAIRVEDPTTRQHVVTFYNVDIPTIERFIISRPDSAPLIKTALESRSIPVPPSLTK